jgi:histidinol-phosphate aminotransferase
MAYERKNIAAMMGYVPGEQIDAPDILKLNTNENPYPPSPSVSQALTAFDTERLRQYPPPTARNLQEAIANKHGLDAGNVLVTNGGDELLRMAIATFVEASETIAVARPTYTLYQVLADAHGCSMTSFELDSDWRLPDNYGMLLNEAEAKLSFLVNPHAPSGTLISIKDISALADTFNGVLLLDEAYIDFVDPDIAYQSEQLIKDHDNILILRTFSKGYSLAGLRMAYGLGSESLIGPLMKTKDSYNTDLISQTLAQAALEDQDYARDTWSKVRQERQLVTDNLRQAGYSVTDSQSNFILATVPENKSAEDIYQALKASDILVRFFGNEKRLEDKLRLTIGTPEENRRLLDALSVL